MLRLLLGTSLGIAVVAGACSIDQTDDLSGATASSGAAASSSASSGSGNTGATGTTASGSGGGTAQQGDYTGTIACGGVECTVPDELCCPADTPPKCVSATSGVCGTSGGQQSGDDKIAMYCDDSTDCASAEQCCFDPASATIYICQPDCAGELESCVFGVTPCSTGLCVVDVSSAGTLASCDATASLPCGTTACSGGTPVCCASGASASCAAIGACQGASFACASAAECGGMHCCADAIGSTCSSACGADQVVLCATITDCPANALGKPATACAPPASSTVALPSGYDVCTY